MPLGKAHAESYNRLSQTRDHYIAEAIKLLQAFLRDGNPIDKKHDLYSASDAIALAERALDKQIQMIGKGSK